MTGQTNYLSAELVTGEHCAVAHEPGGEAHATDPFPDAETADAFVADVKAGKVDFAADDQWLAKRRFAQMVESAISGGAEAVAQRLVHAGLRPPAYTVGLAA